MLTSTEDKTQIYETWHVPKLGTFEIYQSSQYGTCVDLNGRIFWSACRQLPHVVKLDIMKDVRIWKYLEKFRDFESDES